MKFFKKAKSFLKKVRRRLKRAFKKKAGGNWYHPRKQSEAAKSFMKQPVVYFAEPITHHLAQFVYGVVEYYTTYRDEWELPATNLALALMKDVYDLEVLPILSCGRILKDAESIKLMNDELFNLLCEYGGMNIVFHDKKTKVPRRVTKDVVINDELFLTKKRCGIPTRIFLLLHGGGMEIPLNVMSELSGFPMHKTRWGYKEIIRTFQNTTKCKHRKQLLKNKVPSTSKKLRDPSVIYV